VGDLNFIASLYRAEPRSPRSGSEQFGSVDGSELATAPELSRSRPVLPAGSDL